MRPRKGKWIHVAAVYTAKKATVYIDGQKAKKSGAFSFWVKPKKVAK